MIDQREKVMSEPNEENIDLEPSDEGGTHVEALRAERDQLYQKLCACRRISPIRANGLKPILISGWCMRMSISSKTNSCR